MHDILQQIIKLEADSPQAFTSSQYSSHRTQEGTLAHRAKDVNILSFDQNEELDIVVEHDNKNKMANFWS